MNVSLNTSSVICSVYIMTVVFYLIIVHHNYVTNKTVRETNKNIFVAVSSAHNYFLAPKFMNICVVWYAWLDEVVERDHDMGIECPSECVRDENK